MAFKVKLFPDGVDYESLHVAKLTNFPLEPRDYKPYSQARVSFASDGMHLQLLAFEATPLNESRMTAVFNLTPLYETGCVVAELFADGHFSAKFFSNDTGALIESASVHTFTGEDLQGVFWGGNIFLPMRSLKALFPNLVVARGQMFTGNLYKVCENSARPHFGSYYPADFNLPLTDPSNFGEFVMIDY